MKLTLDLMSHHFRYVLIDTPPVMTVSHAPTLARRVDGIVFVVRAGKTPQEIFKKATEELRRVGGNILGVVMNAVDLSTSEYSYYDKYCYDETYLSAYSTTDSSEAEHS